jgi:hypothetical protein
MQEVCLRKLNVFFWALFASVQGILSPDKYLLSRLVSAAILYHQESQKNWLYYHL